MILYIIKFSLCLVIILIVYHLFLEREKMNVFNRYFLLLGLVFSFIAPLVIVGYIPESIADTTILSIIASNDTIYMSSNPTATLSFNFETILLGVYLLISTGLLLRFAFGLFTLLKRIVKSPHVSYKNVQLVLIQEKELPHTFWNYIFINADDYHNNRIEDELFTHELTHANQWHSIDILLIEVCHIILWFIPLLILYKRAIKLNHEFLADERVVESHQHVKHYQYLLLEKTVLNTRNYLASNLNYLLTKKRLEMMTKKTSRLKAYLYATSSIPFFICLLMLFGTKVSGQTDGLGTESIEDIKDTYFKDATFVYTNSYGQKNHKTYKEMTAEERAAIPKPPPPPPIIVEEKTPSEVKSLPNGTLVHVNSDGKIWIDGYGGNLPPPPPPPPPILAKDYIKKMSKEGALFILDGKAISNRRAIRLVSSEKTAYKIHTEKNTINPIITFKKIY